ncbi:glycosyltransferase [Phaeobacter sp. BS52]|uniref:glycosyltransferase n=1 Tax=Phaeobacter sp. BS52 TaxID=2907241 RepID=UPI003703BAE8
MNETLIPEPALQADMQANMQQAGAGRLVAVVVTYNRLAKLKVTLARLLDSPAQELASLVVVDNASNDGTGDWLAKLGGGSSACRCGDQCHQSGRG